MFPDVVGSSGLLEMWQDSLRRIDLWWGDGSGEMCEGSVTELNSTISALGRFAELREVSFNYVYLSHRDPNILTTYRNKLPTLLDAVKDKRYLKVLGFRGVPSDEAYSKGWFKYCVVSKV